MNICLGDDPQQKKLMNLIINGAAMKAIKKSSLVEGLDANNKETFNWLWKRYNKAPFDYETIRIHDYQVEAFEKGVLKDWLPSLGKRAGLAERWFKLPKVLAKGIKGGEDFVGSISEAVSFNQRQLKEGARHIDPMMEGFFKMFKDKESPIITKAKTEWTKKEYEQFQGYEKLLIIL